MNLPNEEKLNCGRVEKKRVWSAAAVGHWGNGYGAATVSLWWPAQTPESPTRPAAHQSSGCHHSAANWTELLPARVPQTVAFLEVRFSLKYLAEISLCTGTAFLEFEEQLNHKRIALKRRRKSPNWSAAIHLQEEGEDLLIEEREDTQVWQTH